ncbi:hypothetical protein GCM10027162_07590 [Streptomyces incanus]
MEHDGALDQEIREHINTARTPAERCRWVRRGKDPSGHLWVFLTHREDVSEEELRRRLAAAG